MKISSCTLSAYNSTLTDFSMKCCKESVFTYVGFELDEPTFRAAILVNCDYSVDTEFQQMLHARWAGKLSYLVTSQQARSFFISRCLVIFCFIFINSYFIRNVFILISTIFIMKLVSCRSNSNGLLLLLWTRSTIDTTLLDDILKFIVMPLRPGNWW